MPRMVIIITIELIVLGGSGEERGYMRYMGNKKDPVSGPGLSLSLSLSLSLGLTVTTQ
jgi:hypothetical protein